MNIKRLKNILAILFFWGLAFNFLSAYAEEASFTEKFGRKLFQKDSNDLLPPDEAFKLKLEAKDQNTMVASFTPAPGYYLYRHKISFNTQNKDIVIDRISMPEGDLKKDIIYGETRVFHQPFTAVVTLKNNQNAPSPAKINLQVSYQGCSEKGVCYPPAIKNLEVNLLGNTAKRSLNSDTTSSPQSFSSFSSDTKIADNLANNSTWIVLAGFFLAGIGLAFTPCILPMIPILSSIIAGHGQTVTRKRGFLLSLSYVLGMSTAYTAAGVAAGLTGSFLAAFLQNAWVLGSFAIVFILLALSMFGLYELRAPSFLTNQASSFSNKLSGGKIATVFGMGALSALIVSPCVAAPLAGALLYIGKTGDVVLGGSALFFLSLGMGAPLIAIGISAGALLPKSGPWMETIKQLFGFVLLGVAIWLITPVIPPSVQMALWAALLIISACFLRAIDPLPADSKGYLRVAKGLGIIGLITGIILLIGALSGSKNILQPLAGLYKTSTTNINGSAQLSFDKIHSLEELEQKLQQSDHPAMLDFYADWCVSCKEMEAFTFKDVSVMTTLNNFLLLKADVTQNSAADQQLLKYFNLVGPPGIIFFDKNGKEMRDHRVVGFLPAKEFNQAINDAITTRNESSATPSSQTSL